MAVLLIDCGRVTLKSPPSRGSDAPHVHQRPRKHLSRCTLDCGSKTSESPALRGFVGERAPIRGTSLYLVLLSNGLRHSKNLPVKFGFLPKTIPANIVQKLSAHSLLKSVFFRISTSLTNAPRSLSQAKVGTHLPLLRGSHTRAHTPKHGPSGRGRYHYPRHVLHVYEHPRAGCQNGVLCRFGILAGRCSRRTQKAFGTAMRLCVSLSRGVAAPLGCVIQ